MWPIVPPDLPDASLNRLTSPRNKAPPLESAQVVKLEQGRELDRVPSALALRVSAAPFISLSLM